MMYVSLREFQKLAIHTSDDVKERKGRIHHSSIIPALFNVLHFLNYSKRLEADRTSKL